jgi:uncharacterized radical SAM superfamily protein
MTCIIKRDKKGVISKVYNYLSAQIPSFQATPTAESTSPEVLINYFKDLFKKFTPNEVISTDVNEMNRIIAEHSAYLAQVEAFHGTGRTFDNFDMSKVGEGQGGSVFGHGIYFTSLKNIADNYAKEMADTEIQDISIGKWKIYEKGVVVGYKNAKNETQRRLVDELTIAEIDLKNEFNKNASVKEEIKNIIRDFIKDSQKELEYGNDVEYQQKAIDEAQTLLNETIKTKLTNSGVVYKVALHEGKTPDQYDFLDWYQKLTPTQAAKIAKQGKKEGINTSGLASPQYTAAEIYSELQKQFRGLDGSAKAASEFLLRAGIDGIQYPPDSLGTGVTDNISKERNYVVFDDKAITIKEQLKFNAPSTFGGERITLENFRQYIDALKQGVKLSPSDLIDLRNVVDENFTREQNKLYDRWQNKELTYDQVEPGKGEFAKPLRTEQMAFHKLLNVQDNPYGLEGDINAPTTYHYTTTKNLASILDSNIIVGDEGEYPGVSTTTSDQFDHPELTTTRWYLPDGSPVTFADGGVRIDLDLQKLKENTKIEKGSEEIGTFIGEQELKIGGDAGIENTLVYIKSIQLDATKMEPSVFNKLKAQAEAMGIPVVTKLNFDRKFDTYELKTPVGVVYGMYFDGKIYLNPEKLSNETTLHEVAHLHQALLKEAAKDGNKQAQAILERGNELLTPIAQQWQNALDEKYAEAVGSTITMNIGGVPTEVRPIAAEVVNGFYSPLEKLISESKVEKIPAKQWLDKFGKGSEAEWVGLNAWLKEQNRSVTKAEIQQFLKDNRVQVVEVVKGSLTLKEAEEFNKQKAALQQQIRDRVSPAAEAIQEKVTRIRREMDEWTGSYSQSGYAQLGEDLREAGEEMEATYQQEFGDIYKKLEELDAKISGNELDTEAWVRSERTSPIGNIVEFKNAGWRIEKRGDKDFHVYKPGGMKLDMRLYPETLTEAKDQITEYFKEQKEVKWGAHTEKGARQNYREILVVLPKQAPMTRNEFMVASNNNGILFGSPERVEEEYNKYLEDIGTDISKSKNFSSAHWDEPNVLVHLRMDTRTDINGASTLFLEELQSDWGQKYNAQNITADKAALSPEQLSEIRTRWEDSQKEYAKLINLSEYLNSSATEDRIKVLSETSLATRLEMIQQRHDEKMLDFNNRKDDAHFFNHTSRQAFADTLIKAEIIAYERQLNVNSEAILNFNQNKEDYNALFDNNFNIKSKIPTAPFITSTPQWVKLAFKVALKEAVKQGVDSISWTNGEQQFERWGSEKIQWQKATERNKERNEERQTLVNDLYNKYGNGWEDKLTPEERAQYSSINDKPKYTPLEGWSINIKEQVGGTAFENTDVDNLMLSANNVVVKTKEQLAAVVDKVLSRERNEAQKQKLIDRLWNRMQTEESGVSMPRREGMNAFYGNPVKGTLGTVGEVAKSVFKQTPTTTKFEDDNALLAASYIEEKPNGNFSIWNGIAREWNNKNGKDIEYTKDEATKIVEELNSISPSIYKIDITPELQNEVKQGIPLFQIIGEKGAKGLENATAVLENLSVAQKLEELGKTPKEILLATGWEKGVEGKWKYEIADGTLKISTNGEYTLSQVLNNSELFKAYPQLKDMKVTISIDPRVRNNSWYIPETNSIEINVKEERLIFGDLIHELQHAIQFIEFFAKGGNTEIVLENLNKIFTKEQLNEIENLRVQENVLREMSYIVELLDDITEKKLNKIFKADFLIKEDLVISEELAKQIEEEWDNLPERLRIKMEIAAREDYMDVLYALDEYLNPIRDRISEFSPYNLYQKLAGEVEARNVTYRNIFTPEARRNRLLSKTEDVVREQQLILLEVLGGKHNIPLFQIVGEQGAKNLNVLNSLFNQAKELEIQGASPQQIENKTGWFKEEGQWKYFSNELLQEFNIKKGLDTSPGKEYTLDQVLENTSLFTLYPQLKNINVHFYKKSEADTANGSYSNGLIRISSREQNIGESGVGNNGGEVRNIINNIESGDLNGSKYYALTLIHEVSHAIQEIENFPRGGNSDTIFNEAKKIIGNSSNKLGEVRDAIAIYLKNNSPSVNESNILSAAQYELDYFFNTNKTDAKYLNYSLLFGEVEARLVADILNHKFAGVDLSNISYTELKKEYTDVHNIMTQFVVRNSQTQLSDLATATGMDLNNPVYARAAEESPEQHLERLVDEVRANLIGKYGAKELDNLSNDKGFLQQLKDWLSTIYEWVAKQFGLKDASSEELANMPLGEFISRSTGAILKGEYFQYLAPQEVDVYDHQDANAERLLEVSFKGEGGNVWKYKIENAGDVLRELAKYKNTFLDPSYIFEKINKIEDFLGKITSDRLSPIDSYAQVSSMNQDRLDLFRAAYEAQPVMSIAQEHARQLALAVVNGDVKAMQQEIAYFNTFRGDNVREKLQEANTYFSKETTRPNFKIEGLSSFEKNTSLTPSSTFKDTKGFPTYTEALAAHDGLNQKNIYVNQNPSKDNADKVLTIQVSSQYILDRQREGNVTEQGQIFDDYFDKVYSKVEGYDRSVDFMEVPFWIAAVNNSVGKDMDMYVMRDPEETLNFIQQAGYKKVMLSVLDANLSTAQTLVKDNPSINFMLGGYIPNLSSKFNTTNASTFDTMEDGVLEAGYDFKDGYKYDVFKGMEIIPRLKMSEGCLFNCAFCTVVKKIEKITKENIDEQVENISKLNAKYIYLDDKTFGQADNYTYLEDVYQRVKEQQPGFKGFIIQTTSATVKKIDSNPGFWQKAGIALVEIGVESNNDSVMRGMSKPNSERLNAEAVQIIRKNGMKFIPNLIIGFEKETAATYENTIKFLKDNADVISHANIYNLAVYEGTALDDMMNVTVEADRNENMLEKSFHSNPQLHAEYFKKMYKTVEDMIDANKIAPTPQVASELFSEIAANPHIQSNEDANGIFQNVFSEKFKKFFGDWTTPSTNEDIEKQLENVPVEKLHPTAKALILSTAAKMKSPSLYFKGIDGKTGVNAHPDVEGIFAATTYEMAKEYDRGSGVDFYLVDSPKVETVRVETNVPFSVARQNETTEINAAKADVVFLSTFDAAGKRETQVVIKNPKVKISGKANPLVNKGGEPKLFYRTPEGKVFTNFADALNNTNIGSIEMGFISTDDIMITTNPDVFDIATADLVVMNNQYKLENPDSFLKVAAIDSNSNPKSISGFINKYLRQGLIAPNKKQMPNGEFKLAGKGELAINSIVSAAILSDEALADLGREGMTLSNDGTFTLNQKDESVIEIPTKDGGVKQVSISDLEKGKIDADLDGVHDVLFNLSYQKSTPFKGVPISKQEQDLLKSKLLGLLNKMGISVVSITEYTAKYKVRTGTDLSVNALVDLANGVVALSDNATLQDLTEEVAHIIIEAHPNQQEIRDLLKEIENTPEWETFSGEYYQKYSELYEGEELEEAVRREILGKILLNNILEGFANTAGNPSLFQKLIAIINSFINRIQAHLNVGHRTALQEYMDMATRIALNEDSEFLDRNVLKQSSLVLYSVNNTVVNTLDVTRRRLLGELEVAKQHIQSNQRILQKLKDSGAQTLKSDIRRLNAAIAKIGTNTATLNKAFADDTLTEEVKLEALNNSLNEVDEFHAVQVIASMNEAQITNLSNKLRIYKKTPGAAFNFGDQSQYRYLTTVALPQLDRLIALFKTFPNQPNVNKDKLVAQLEQQTIEIHRIQGEAYLQENKDVEQIVDRTLMGLNLPDSSTESGVVTKENIKASFDAVQRDVNVLQKVFGQLEHAPNIFLNLLGKIVANNNMLANLATLKIINPLIAYAEKNNWNITRFKSLRESSVSNYLISVIRSQDFDNAEKKMIEDAYEANLTDEKKEEIAKAKRYPVETDLTDEGLDKFLKAKNDWYEENLERPMVAKYYQDKENLYTEAGVGNELRVFLANLASRKAEILEKYRVSGSVDYSKIEEEDQYNLSRIVSDRKARKSFFNAETGEEKTGVDLEIANQLRKLDEIVQTKMNNKVAQSLFSKNFSELRPSEVVKVQEAKKKTIKNEFFSAVRDIESTDGSQAAFKFLMANGGLNFSDAYWNAITANTTKMVDRVDAIRLNDSRITPEHSRTMKASMDELEELLNSKKEILRQFTSANSPAEIEYDLMGELTKKNIIEKEDRIQELFLDVNTILSKYEEKIEDPFSYSENTTNEAYTKALADSGKPESEFLLLHMTEENKSRVRRFTSALKNVQRGGENLKAYEDYFDRKYGVNSSDDVRSLLTNRGMEELVADYSRERVTSYFKRFAPMGYDALLINLKDGTYSTTKLLDDLEAAKATAYAPTNILHNLAISTRFEWVEEGEDLRNPDYKTDSEFGFKQPKISKWRNDEYFRRFNPDANGQATTNLEEFTMLQKLKAVTKDAHIKYEEEGRNINKIPQVRRGKYERIQNASWDAIKNSVKDVIYNREDEKDYGEQVEGQDTDIRIIPKYYLRDLDDMEDVSNDFIYSYAVLQNAANTFEQRINSIADVSVIQNKLLNSKFDKGKAPASTNVAEAYREAMDAYFYGRRLSAKSSITLQNGKEVDVSRMAVHFNNLIKKAALGFSPTIAITSALVSNIQLAIYNRVGLYINTNSSRWAGGELSKLLPEYTTEIGKVNKQNKLYKLGETFGVHEIATKTKSAGYNRILRSLNDSPYAFMEMAATPHANIVMLSVLDDFRLVGDKFLTYEEFKLRADNANIDSKALLFKWNTLRKDSLYNLLENREGIMQLSEATENAIGKEYADALLSRVQSKIISTNNTIDSKTSADDKSAASRHFMMQFFTNFKDWFTLGVQKRFKRKHLNLRQGIEEEGHYITFKHFISDLTSLAYKDGLTKAISSIKSNYRSLSKTEQANLKLIALDVAAFTILTMLGMLVMAAADDDKNKHNWAIQYLSFIYFRTTSEVGSSQAPTGFLNVIDIIKSPIMAGNTMSQLFTVKDWTSDPVTSGTWEGYPKVARLLLRNTYYKHYMDLRNADAVREKTSFYRMLNSEVLISVQKPSKLEKEKLKKEALDNNINTIDKTGGI